ncbi:MAG: hypothetical protein J07HQX50_02259 [Haloquadratum sp. J07HQX50]|jgi:hypothetical protein|nr:MAG: hypothetical protein J07HQX50_02259 [Haloquadratum sp. J07HQX50]
MTHVTVGVQFRRSLVTFTEATAGSCEKMRHLSTSTAGETRVVEGSEVEPPTLTGTPDVRV